MSVPVKRKKASGLSQLIIPLVALDFCFCST